MDQTSHDDYFQDHLIIHHPDGNTDRFPLPEDAEKIIRVGRELDNDIVLTDPRASRHHAELRRITSVLEAKDLNSANGILLNKTKIEPDAWVKVTPGQTLQLAETRLIWEKAASSQSTMAMARTPRQTTKASPVPPPAPAPTPAAAAPQKDDSTPLIPWVIGLGLGVLALIVAGIFAFLFLFSGTDGQPDDVAGQPPADVTVIVAPTLTSPSDRTGEGSLDSQSLSGDPTSTPTPSGPQLAIPVVEVERMRVFPIIFGASPSTNSAYIFIDVRARNVGNIPFQFSISNFSLETRDGGQTFEEAGATTSENYLRQLGAINRFENLALTPGGSVPGSLIFELEIGTYDLELVFKVPDLDPIVLGLDAINMDRELKLAAGTPLAELDAQTGGQPASTPTPTVEPTPTPTRPPLIPAPAEVSRSALVGTIAYPVYNGTDYDIYFADVATGDSQFFRAHASQPAFSPDGSRIAFHSWDGAFRGLATMDVSGANAILVGGFIEDQLPTWTADGNEIVFLTRRTGDRKSTLVKVGSNEERTDGTVLGEGEYPAIGPNGQLVFKGWGNTAFGLRTSSANMDDIQTITNADEDTAPTLSPDGQKVAFMSRREGNWNIYTVNIDGSNLQQLTTDDAEDGLPTWSPDGNALAFVSDRGGIWAVWAMTPDGKGKSQIFTMQGPPDGFVGTDNFASRGWAEERISWIK